MTNKIPQKVLKEIHNTIQYIWEYDIPRDYSNRLLLSAFGDVPFYYSSYILPDLAQ